MKFKINVSILFYCMIAGNLLAQPYMDYIGGGHNKGITITASSSSGASTAQKTMDGSGMNDNLMAASRFLGQATLGANSSAINSALNMGFEPWIDDQFTKAPTNILPTMNSIWSQIETLAPEAFGPYALHFNYAWWQVNMTCLLYTSRCV